MKCDASPVTGLLHKPGKPDRGRRRYRSKTDKNIETIYCGWYRPASLPPRTGALVRTTDVAPNDGAMMKRWFLTTTDARRGELVPLAVGFRTPNRQYVNGCTVPHRVLSTDDQST